MNGSRFKAWLDGDLDVMEGILDLDETQEDPRELKKENFHKKVDELGNSGEAQLVRKAEEKSFKFFYKVISAVSCICLIGVLLFSIANLPRYGMENPEATEVTDRYLEKGVEETGAINVVAGLILDYRAFDTLGESHVLFTALVCVLILLRLTPKSRRRIGDDYYIVRSERYHRISMESIMREVAALLVPCILVYGIYVILNGQNGPGGGFSGGAVLGSGMIIFSAAYGFEAADRVLTAKMCTVLTFAALTFYSFAKGYVFFTGANHLENHIPKGTPGAILSGGLILPLDIAVGLVVACTMYGFYSLFMRGAIGRD